MARIRVAIGTVIKEGISMYLIKVRTSFLGIKFWRRFECSSYVTEVAIVQNGQQIAIKPRLGLILAKGGYRYIPDICSKELSIEEVSDGNETSRVVDGGAADSA